MPKKFQGENSKSVEARARKASAKKDDAEKKQKAAEDAYWADDDKHLAKKAQRKDDKDKKRQEQLDKKRELAKLHDEEMDSIKGKGKPSNGSSKVTRHDLELRRQRLEAAEAAQRAQDKSITVVEDTPLVENLNKLSVDGEARTVDEAIDMLDTTPGSSSAIADKHPEKRVKAAYQDFEDRRMPILKQENPNLRLSQLRQMLKKEWQKSSENPLNARML